MLTFDYSQHTGSENNIEKFTGDLAALTAAQDDTHVTADNKIIVSVNRTADGSGNLFGNAPGDDETANTHFDLATVSGLFKNHVSVNVSITGTVYKQYYDSVALDEWRSLANNS